MPPYIVSVLLSLLLLGATLAAPQKRSTPTVVPGPGQPSLEDLGVTSEQLYNFKLPTPPPPVGISPRAPQSSPGLVPTDPISGAPKNVTCTEDFPVDTYDALALYSYIYFRQFWKPGSSTTCGAKLQPIWGWQSIVTAGTAQLLVVSIGGSWTGELACADMQWHVYDMASVCGLDAKKDSFSAVWIGRSIHYTATDYGNGLMALVIRNTDFPATGQNFTLPAAVKLPPWA
ncbi:hypothetical protein BJ875DRAFT_441889 [Amylocarpus encephaloides]|uniref:Secreted protein n=1 Tax=Amylocarpus encephaloides TaxID=45428 RepID=A0A9P7YHR4_9HELO|nr:hypothetical protein BJ875DRAFT_441889 [Amylocarpus encephaloides]